MGKTSAAVKNKYAAKAYDQLRIVVPKGRKQAIEAHAKGKGESINGLVNTLLRADMGLTEEQWKEKIPLAWDPDFTKLTPAEAEALERAEEEIKNGETVPLESLPWYDEH